MPPAVAVLVSIEYPSRLNKHRPQAVVSLIGDPSFHRDWTCSRRPRCYCLELSKRYIRKANKVEIARRIPTASYSNRASQPIGKLL